MTQNYLLDVLKALEKIIPPPSNCHHAIGYQPYGTDTQGWQDKLALHVHYKGLIQTLFLDANDFALSANELVNAIVAELRNRPADPNLLIRLHRTHCGFTFLASLSFATSVYVSFMPYPSNVTLCLLGSALVVYFLRRRRQIHKLIRQRSCEE